MNIVIPMAGAGSRFPRAIYGVPKPLIHVANEPMYRWAVRGLGVKSDDRLIFVILEDQFTDDISADISMTFGDCDLFIRVLREQTRGQAETVLCASDLLLDNQSLLIHNADTCVELPDDWRDELSTLDGALVVFESDEERWSYARTNLSGEVVEVREKEVISNHASTGTYWFAKTTEFIERARLAVRDDVRDGGEFYVAPLFNGLIGAGGSVKLIRTKDSFCFGTPDDLSVDGPRFTQRLALDKSHRSSLL